MSIPPPTSPGIPADWYPDPAGTPTLRWWDGGQWTNHVKAVTPSASSQPALPATPVQAELPVAPVAPVVPVVPVVSVVSVAPSLPSLPSRRELRAERRPTDPNPASPVPDPTPAPPVASTLPAPLPAPATPTPPAEPVSSRLPAPSRLPEPSPLAAPPPPVQPMMVSSELPRGSYIPFSSKLSGDNRTWIPPVVNTVWIWFLATSPLWLFAIDATLVYFLGGLFTIYMQLLFVALAFALSVYFVIRDHRRLVYGGHDSTASPWWILLSPLAYLIARAVHIRRTTKGGRAPIFVWILCNVVIAGLAVAAVIFSPAFRSLLEQVSRG